MHNDLKFIKEHDELINEYEKQLKNPSLNENVNSILIGYKIASQFDEYTSIQKDNESYKMNFDDLIIFKEAVNKKSSLQTCLKLNKNDLSPQAFYFYIKNINLLNEFFQNYEEKDFEEFFDENKALSSIQPYLRMWVYLLRNMSSINYIYFENKNNPLLDEISKFIQSKIEQITKENKKINPM